MAAQKRWPLYSASSLTGLMTTGHQRSSRFIVWDTNMESVTSHSTRFELGFDHWGTYLCPWLNFWGTFSFLGGQKFDRSRTKKSNFAGFLRDKFAEKSADFAGVLGANFTEKQSVKNGGFCSYFRGKFL